MFFEQVEDMNVLAAAGTSVFSVLYPKQVLPHSLVYLPTLDEAFFAGHPSTQVTLIDHSAVVNLPENPPEGVARAPSGALRRFSGTEEGRKTAQC